MVRGIVWLIGLTSLLCSCQSIDEEDLLGTWKADQGYQSPDTLDIDLEDYFLHFSENKHYKIEQHGQVLQTGTFSTDQNVVLFNLDSIAHPIQLISQSPDSLILRMNYDSVDLTLKFLRQPDLAEH